MWIFAIAHNVYVTRWAKYKDLCGNKRSPRSQTKNWVDSGLLISDLVYLIIGYRVEFLELTFRSEGQSK